MAEAFAYNSVNYDAALTQLSARSVEVEKLAAGFNQLLHHPLIRGLNRSSKQTQQQQYNARTASEQQHTSNDGVNQQHYLTLDALNPFLAQRRRSEAAAAIVEDESSTAKTPKREGKTSAVFIAPSTGKSTRVSTSRNSRSSTRSSAGSPDVVHSMDVDDNDAAGVDTDQNADNDESAPTDNVERVPEQESNDADNDAEVSLHASPAPISAPTPMRSTVTSPATSTTPLPATVQLSRKSMARMSIPKDAEEDDDDDAANAVDDIIANDFAAELDDVRSSPLAEAVTTPATKRSFTSAASLNEQPEAPVDDDDDTGAGDDDDDGEIMFDDAPASDVDDNKENEDVALEPTPKPVKRAAPVRRTNATGTKRNRRQTKQIIEENASLVEAVAEGNKQNDADGSRRSGRTQRAPLAYWTTEHLIYKRGKADGHDRLMGSPQYVAAVKTPARAYSPNQKSSKKNKSKARVKH